MAAEYCFIMIKISITFGLTNRYTIVYYQKNIYILFALHYIQQNARSTVQTEQAMPEMLEGVGPGRAKRQQI